MAVKDNESSNSSYITGGLYRFLKFISLVFLPAFATFYAALGQVWGFGHIEDVVLTITSFDTFVGVILGVTSAGRSNANVIDGDIHVVNSDDGSKQTLQMALDSDPATLADKKTVTFKIRQKPAPK